LREKNILIWVKDSGWRILIVSLALETLFSGIVFACDSEISRQQKFKLEKERNARVAILDQLKPRDITRKQMATIVDAIKGRFGTVYLYPLSDPDSFRYTFAVSETLKAAGIDVKLMLGRDEKSGAPIFPDKFDVPVPRGVTAYEFPQAGENGFVNTIVLAFSRAGLSINGHWSEKPLPNVASPAIFIGRKPEPFEQFPAYATPLD
jgi:hypothetical protein